VSVTIDRKIDLGHIITLGVMFVGFAIQYGSLSARVSTVEIQVAQAATINQTLTVTLNNLQNTIVKVETQMSERERRFDQRQDDRDLRDLSSQSAARTRK
jgi:flagellar motor component MotA